MSDTLTTRPTPAIDITLAVCGGIITATASLSAITALTELAPWIPVTLAVTAAVTGAVQVTLRGWVQSQSVPVSDVVEAVQDGQVVAGPANAIPTGETIRVIGEPLDPPPAQFVQAQTRAERRGRR